MFAHAHSVSGSTQHCFAPLEPSRGRQEDQHTQFARRMETKVVVATMWLSVGIGWNIQDRNRSSLKFMNLPSSRLKFRKFKMALTEI